MFRKLVQLFAQHLKTELVQWLEAELLKFEGEPVPAAEPVAADPTAVPEGQ